MTDFKRLAGIILPMLGEYMYTRQQERAMEEEEMALREEEKAGKLEQQDFMEYLLGAMPKEKRGQFEGMSPENIMRAISLGPSMGMDFFQQPEPEFEDTYDPNQMTMLMRIFAEAGLPGLGIYQGVPEYEEEMSRIKETPSGTIEEMFGPQADPAAGAVGAYGMEQYPEMMPFLEGLSPEDAARALPGMLGIMPEPTEPRVMQFGPGGGMYVPGVGEEPVRVPPVEAGPTGLVGMTPVMGGVNWYNVLREGGEITDYDRMSQVMFERTSQMSRGLRNIGVTGVGMVGAYEDRTIAGTDRPSLHAEGNAVDIHGFEINGQYIAVADMSQEEQDTWMEYIRPYYENGDVSVHEGNHIHVSIPSGATPAETRRLISPLPEAEEAEEGYGPRTWDTASGQFWHENLETNEWEPVIQKPTDIQAAIDYYSGRLAATPVTDPETGEAAGDIVAIEIYTELEELFNTGEITQEDFEAILTGAGLGSLIMTGA